MEIQLINQWGKYWNPGSGFNAIWLQLNTGNAIAHVKTILVIVFLGFGIALRN